MLNDPPHELLNIPTATAPLPRQPSDEMSIWTSKAWDEVSYNQHKGKPTLFLTLASTLTQIHVTARLAQLSNRNH